MSTTAYQIIAVDFDGTLCYSNWPELGEPNRPLIEYLIDQKRSGNKLILWTCRAGEALEKAVSWCRDHQLEFDAINDNLPEIIEMYGNNSRKITCDYYIDDKAEALELLSEINKKIEGKKKGAVIKAALTGLKDFIINTGAALTAAMIQAKIQGLF